MFPVDGLPLDHWVSRGYQQNFASPDKRVAITDARSGRLLDAGRPVRSNFRRRGFNASLDSDGTADTSLERAFSEVERSILNEIRLIGRSRRGPAQKAAAANLCAIHLVRNPAFCSLYDLVVERYREVLVLELAAEAQLRELYEATFGQSGNDGSLEGIVDNQLDDMIYRRSMLVQSMARQHDLMAEKLNGYHMQVFEVAPHLSGLAIGDVPVVHVNSSSGAHGFRDELALGDADFIMAPLTRRVGVCFTVQVHPFLEVKTRAQVDLINAVSMRAAMAELACHPDDVVQLQQISRRLDRLPLHRLIGVIGR